MPEQKKGRLQRVRDPQTGAVTEYILDTVRYSAGDFRKRLQEMVTSGEPDGEAIVSRVEDFRSLRTLVPRWKQLGEQQRLSEQETALPTDYQSIREEIGDLQVAVARPNLDPMKKRAYRARLAVLERKMAGAASQQGGAQRPNYGPEFEARAQAIAKTNPKPAPATATPAQPKKTNALDSQARTRFKALFGRDATDEEIADFLNFVAPKPKK